MCVLDAATAIRIENIKSINQSINQLVINLLEYKEKQTEHKGCSATQKVPFLTRTEKDTALMPQQSTNRLKRGPASSKLLYSD